MSAKQALQNRRSILWWGIFAFSVCLSLYLFYTPVTTIFEYTFQKPPSAPGTLFSERWSRDFFFIGTLVLLWLVPLTAAFMSDSPCRHGRQVLHVIVVLMLWVYFMVVMGFWIFDFAKANQGTAANQRNRANDDRWCCVHYVLAGAACENTAMCAGVTAADFVVNPAFLWRFWWLIVFIFFLVIDFYYTIRWFQPAIKAYINEVNGIQESAPEQEQDDEAKPLLRRIRTKAMPAYKGIRR